MVTTQQQDQDPTSEFNARCVSVLQGWQTGTLPFREAIARLLIYSQEAIAERHLANQGRAEQLLGNIQHYHGNLTTSIRHWEQARTLFEQVNNRRRAAIMDMNIGESYRYRGELERALQLYRKAREIAEEFSDLTSKTIAVVNEGLALAAMRDDDVAEQAFEAGLVLAAQWGETQGDTQRDSRLSTYCEVYDGLAAIALRRGDPNTAWEHAAAALALLDDPAVQPRHYGYAHRTAGVVLTHFPNPPDSRWDTDPDEHFRLALEAFREINIEPELASTIYEQALSLAARGRVATAARKLQQVIIMFSRLGMMDYAARATEAQARLSDLRS